MNCSNAARDESVTLVSGSADSTEPGYRRNYWFSTCSERLDARLELLLLRRFGLSKKTKAKKAKTSRRLKQDRLGSRGGQRHEVGYEVRSLAASVKSAVKMVGNSRTRVERPSEGLSSNSRRSELPKENDLEGHQDQGGKHGGQAGMPKPVPRPRTTERDEDIIRKGSKQISRQREQ
jgi:hypothetical protein